MITFQKDGGNEDWMTSLSTAQPTKSIMPTQTPSLNSLYSNTATASGYNPTTFSESFGGADKYFSKQLKDLGWKGSVFDNSSLYGNPEVLGQGAGSGELGANPEFLKWAQANGLGLSTKQDGDTSFLRLLQGDNVLGEAKYKNENWLDKAAKVGVPLAIAAGLGGMGSEIFGAVSGAAAPSALGGTIPGVSVPSATVPGLTGTAGGWGATGAALGSTLGPAGGSLLSGAGTLAGAMTPAAGGASTAAPGATSITPPTGLVDSAAADAITQAGTLAPGGLQGLIPSGSELAQLGGGSLLAGGLLGGGAGDKDQTLLDSILKAGGGAIKDAVKGGGGGDTPTAPGNPTSGTPGGPNYGNILSQLMQMYAGNQYQSSVMDLYKSLDSSFAPGSAYEQTLRQELDRRDAAAGRRSQYGPREVELQAKLASQRGQQATTLAGLLDKSQTGMNSMLQAGAYLGEETGLTDLFGGKIKDVGDNIIKGVTDSDWWQELFGGD